MPAGTSRSQISGCPTFSSRTSSCRPTAAAPCTPPPRSSTGGPTGAPRWTAGPWVSSSTSWSTARCPSMATTTRLWSSRSPAGTTGSPRSSQVGTPPPPVCPPSPRPLPCLTRPFPRCLRADPVDADGEPRAPGHHRGHRHALVGQLGLQNASGRAGAAAGERIHAGHGGRVAAPLVPAPAGERLQGALLPQAAHPRRGPGAAALPQEVQEGERRLAGAAGGARGPRELLQVRPQAAQGHPEEEELLRAEGAQPRRPGRGGCGGSRGAGPAPAPRSSGSSARGRAQEGNPEEALGPGVGLLLVPGVLRLRGRAGRGELGPGRGRVRRAAPAGAPGAQERNPQTQREILLGRRRAREPRREGFGGLQRGVPAPGPPLPAGQRRQRGQHPVHGVLRPAGAARPPRRRQRGRAGLRVRREPPAAGGGGGAGGRAAAAPLDCHPLPQPLGGEQRVAGGL
ncbi:hypothetical protein RLOC_00008336 [Lonchura striata]|uniref:Uncharacterized protein n=1 Tax=Lonchura striata TaxID=40157 RepID=A0A218UGV9_9PASE|nr:hypothetical protein RLOC_00008336 [Lonchura striata domestica]